ncbi:hypothetical protein [Absidia glauca]|uniref:F-box domain-containing protein n=1 Tax=Absidia glauca TaxID=4829 RepID=A0A168MRG7_ABSGL|nr:hypothetical protein [Absidia glauca]
MASRNPLKSHEPNVVTNTGCHRPKLPHIIKDLYKSSDTLRRLRTPIPLRQHSTHNHTPAQPRTSRWSSSNSPVIGTKVKPLKKTTPRKSTNTSLAITFDEELAQRTMPSHQMPRYLTTSTPHAIQRANKLPINMLSTQTALSQPLAPSSSQPLVDYPTPPPPPTRSTDFEGSSTYEELFTSPIYSRERPTRSALSPNQFDFFYNGFGAPLLDTPDRPEVDLQSQQLELSQPWRQPKDRDSPVYNLTDDCLIEIFQWCASSTTLCRLSAVCRHWRNVALLPYVWRTIDYTWYDFVQQQEPLRRNDYDLFCTKRRRLDDKTATLDQTTDSLTPLEHVRTITISDIGRRPYLLTPPPDRSPFASVLTLRLTSMQFNDIVNLIDWYPNLQVLDCDRIQTLASQVTVALTAFRVLGQLRVLKLHFASMCELAEGMAFNLGTSQAPTQQLHSPDQKPRWSLPPQLHTLKLANIYDSEECMISGTSAAREDQDLDAVIQLWDTMEEILVRKYWVLTTLHNLTDLALDNCTAFTARVWRECVAPCTKHLKRLSLCGWDGDGSRESPLVARDNAAIMDDVEMALAELFAGLVGELESLTLINFKGSPGVIHGLTLLAQQKNKVPVLSYLDDKLQKSFPSINDLAHSTIINRVEIKFGQLD